MDSNEFDKKNDPVYIEIYTGLTLNYTVQSTEYKEVYFIVLKKLLFLNSKKLLPISAKALQQLIKNRIVTVEVVAEILNEMHYHGVLIKGHYQNQDCDYGFAII